ncbi:hypothetical protein Dimus_017022 [Dionaea muscipula]
MASSRSSRSFSSSSSSGSTSSSSYTYSSTCSSPARLSSRCDGSLNAEITSKSSCSHARSISLPSKPNPILRKLEEQLIKLKAWEESSTSAAETIAIGLSGMADLYRCIDHAISLPATQQALFFHHKGTCIQDLLEASANLLDICNSTRLLVTQLKEAARDLRSALSTWRRSRMARRRPEDGDVAAEAADDRGSIALKCCIACYVCTRKTVVKISKGILLSLKKVDQKFGQLPSNEQGRLSVFIKALHCVSIINISIQESLLFFLATPVACKPKSRRWSVASRFLEGRTSGGGDHGAKKRDQVGDVDVALRAMCRDDVGKKVDEKKVEAVVRRLEELEGSMGAICKGLDATSEQLIKTQSSLLSIFSF